MELHPHCQPLSFLVGTWRGSGAGHYPTIDSFEYNEEVVFGHVGKPFLTYAQKTKRSSTGEPLHAESGYLRVVGHEPDASQLESPQLELVVVQPSGIVEIHQGTLVDQSIILTLHSVQTTPTAKSVTDVQRRFDVASDTLTYDVSMAAVGQPLTHHLHAELTRETTD